MKKETNRKHEVDQVEILDLSDLSAALARFADAAERLETRLSASEQNSPEPSTSRQTTTTQWLVLNHRHSKDGK